MSSKLGTPCTNIVSLRDLVDDFRKTTPPPTVNPPSSPYNRVAVKITR